MQVAGSDEDFLCNVGWMILRFNRLLISGMYFQSHDSVEEILHLGCLKPENNGINY